MTAQRDYERYSKEHTELLNQVAKHSANASKAREKESKARSDASKLTNVSTQKSKLHEAERQAKTANSEDKKKNDYEKKAVAKLTQAQNSMIKAQKEQAASQQRALQDLERKYKSSNDTNLRRIESIYSQKISVNDHTQYDVFLSHASEDKEDIARPLYKELTALGLNVWFDEATLSVGDSLRKKIDQGLTNSKFGVVIISHSFFNKNWPQTELDGLHARQLNSGEKVILPIWHNISKDEVAQRSTLLLDILSLSSALLTVKELAMEINTVVTNSN